MIGIVGGMGPNAGLVVAQEVFNQMNASCDQDFLDLTMISLASRIPDRTEYIKDPISCESPASLIVESIEKLEKIGAYNIGIACNTAHCNLIWNEMMKLLNQQKINVNLVSIIQAVIDYIKSLSINRVGLLATKGTYLSGVYKQAFEQEETLEIIYPNEATQDELHELIYGKIKGQKLDESGKQSLHRISKNLVNQGAQLCILGCTDLCPEFWNENDKLALLDSKVALAKALITADLSTSKKKP